MALYPKSKGFIDPDIYRAIDPSHWQEHLQDCEKARLTRMVYAYPLFRIKDPHRWEEQMYGPIYRNILGVQPLLALPLLDVTLTKVGTHRGGKGR